ncbi:lysine-2,3-aminomutase-like protein [Inquilinus limosus]|uniref:Lysine 2,3-aminomutase n=1 Tax=Inquilinus limosus TaxID=171674 RepID=A0A211ZJP7_9PROT|nr:lysine-2,3-aminomutase-like protein [Inquilinus limosus]OWJ65515.1 lysine 2,3-aminomutase [Inquilinus limosus]
MPKDGHLPPQRLRSPEALVEAGLAGHERLQELRDVASRYAIAVTPAMVDLVDPADPHDPIGRQFVPGAAELETRPEELADPIGDGAHSPIPGLVHRYPDRVLLKLLHACPVYCRFCFRREMVGPGGEAMGEDDLAAAIGYIRARPQVWEAILTGGDPLMLAPRRLADVVARLDAIPHLGVVRLHSRVPVVEPERVTPELVAALKAQDSAVWLAIHSNHPRELTPAARDAIRRLADAGVALVSQTVLLRGVNDDPAVLEQLFRDFVRLRIKPYYLHHGDLAPGTAQFRTGIEDGRRIMKALRGRLSGLAQPTYVLDIPGGRGKVPIGPDHLDGSDAGGWTVEDPNGCRHVYPPKG